MAGTKATCAGEFDCDIIGGKIGVSPGTSLTGNFIGDEGSTEASAGCAADGLDALQKGRAMSGTTMLAEMGGVTFTPGVYTQGSANIALANPYVYLDAEDNPNAVFIFNVGSTLTTCANSIIVLERGAKAENVFWVLDTSLTMGADSILVGNVLAGAAITIGTRGKILGRAIAQTAVTCDTACTVDSSTPSMTIAEYIESEPDLSILYSALKKVNNDDDDAADCSFFCGCTDDAAATDENVPSRKLQNSALRRNNLLTILDQPGDFTYFAPTNDAFNLIPEDCLEKLLKDEELLKDLVLYHGFVGGRFTNSLKVGERINTFLDDENILVTKTPDGAVLINTLDLAGRNITLSNGVAQRISGVLRPSSFKDFCPTWK
jgi:uncharacterized surface protein with fasciclin (FAS1) repeats